MIKYIPVLLCLLFAAELKATDTLYVESYKDERYQRYLDSVRAYDVGYAVAKSISDTIKKLAHNNTYEAYFLHKFKSNIDTILGGFFYVYNDHPDLHPGHVTDEYRGSRVGSKFPWGYLDKQYKRLDSLKVTPCGVIEGAELPNVYVYCMPQKVVVVQVVKRFTVIDPSIKFLTGKDGKTKVSYINKFHYSKVGEQLQHIDSIEKLDPITQKHLFY